MKEIYDIIDVIIWYYCFEVLCYQGGAVVVMVW